MMVGVCICRARPDGRHNEIRGKKEGGRESKVSAYYYTCTVAQR